MRITHVIDKDSLDRHAPWLCEIFSGLTGLGVRQQLVGVDDEAWVRWFHRSGVLCHRPLMSMNRLSLMVPFLGYRRWLSRRLSLFDSMMLIAWGEQARDSVRHWEKEGVIKCCVFLDEMQNKGGRWDYRFVYQEALRRSLIHEQCGTEETIQCLPLAVSKHGRPCVLSDLKKRHAIPHSALVAVLQASKWRDVDFVALLMALKDQSSWYVWVAVDKSLVRDIESLSVHYGVRPRLRFVEDDGETHGSYVQASDGVIFMNEEDIFRFELVRAWAYGKAVLANKPLHLDGRLEGEGMVRLIEPQKQAWSQGLETMRQGKAQGMAQRGYDFYVQHFKPSVALPRWHACFRAILERHTSKQAS
ncbi:MAG: hypothetical protein GDA54_00620 [Alphaproteobacteria bacterium GM7ARS4]|nr:hypothetical protein [Alphaproteobacteria bacterium GM7ARS4]